MKLLTPIQVGDLNLSNRILMAPLTRCRATLDHTPTQIMAEYYGQRASAGLMIAEATMISQDNSAFYREPGIYSPEQVAKWKTVTDSVHSKSGKIFLQLWHGGRACHPVFNNGKGTIAPSAIAIDGEVHSPQGKVKHVTPRAVGDGEIPGLVQEFKTAAQNAKQAGFDGVEVHSANGYLIDQFLRTSSNHRTGPYGGPLENRSRFLKEVLQAVISVWGAPRVGLRISPLNSYNSMQDQDPIGLTVHVAKIAAELKLAYLHVMRADFFGIQKADILPAAREYYPGVLIGNMGYSAQEANSAIESGLLDAVAFGHHYVSNPDLVEKIKSDRPFVEPDQSTYYTHEAKGYSDYGTG